LGTSLTVPPGMEPGSAPACMSVMGYDPAVYYKGRSAIEARSMGVPIDEGEVAFRCNLVTVAGGQMASYSAGHITTAEAGKLIAALNEKLGSESVRFFPGVNYRHICKIKGREETLRAICTPPHDISGKAIEGHLPSGEGGEYLRKLMKESEAVLENHPVNIARKNEGKQPATTIWLFWASGQIPGMPPFDKAYGLKAALTSGVDLLRGLGMMAGMEILHINGVNDQLDNDYAGQVNGALQALEKNDLVVVHIEAPDEMGHKGSIDEKIRAIELIDSEVISRLRQRKGGDLKVLVMPDHPTPIEIKTHYAEPVPFLIWGKGVRPNGANRFTEKQALGTGVAVEPGYKTMGLFIKG
jgi:2,3-bisphosphoglycerate-independent phosphoglycerate mutase